MRSTRTAAILLAAVATTAMGGCATKGFVREQVGVVDTKLQGTQAQVDQNRSQIETHGQHLAQLDQASQEALQRADAAGKLAEGKFTYSTVLADDSIVFAPNRADLTDEAKIRLTELATKLKNDNRNVYLEIQGYTDRREFRRNRRLGDQRAETVRRFLNQQGIALNRMATISFGDRPAPTAIATSGGVGANASAGAVNPENATPDSAATATPTTGAAYGGATTGATRSGPNRRVVIMVMA
jgi:outer membrane protein OmpA-like peptidoglycan-associated protein